MPPKLTPTARRIWKLLDSHVRTGALMPTLREIAAQVHMSKSGIEPHLKLLDESGILIRTRFKARSITLRVEYPHQPPIPGEFSDPPG